MHVYANITQSFLGDFTMKKLTALLLAVLMVVSVFVLSGCKQKSAYDLVMDATEKTSELDAFDAEYEITLDASVMGMGFDVPVSGVIQVSGIDDIDDLEAYVSFEVDLSDVESLLAGFGAAGEFSDPIEGEVAYADGWLYVQYNMMGEEGSAKADISEYIDEIMGELDGMDINEVAEELPAEVSAIVEEMEDMLKELLEDAEVERDGGNRIVELDFDTDDFNDFIGGVLSLVGYAADMDLPGISIEELAFSYIINKKEYIVGINSAIEISMDIQGISMDMAADIEVSLNDPGSKVKVKTIRGCDDFEEVDADEIFG